MESNSYSVIQGSLEDAMLWIDGGRNLHRATDRDRPASQLIELPIDRFVGPTDSVLSRQPDYPAEGRPRDALLSPFLDPESNLVDPRTRPGSLGFFLGDGLGEHELRVSASFECV